MEHKLTLLTIITILVLIGIASAWQINLEVDGGRLHTLAFGVQEAATYEFDRKIDKISPPPPPEGFYTYFYIKNPGKPFLERLWEDYRAPEDNITWTLHFRRSKSPIKIKWDPGQIGDKTIYINNEHEIHQIKTGEFVCQPDDTIFTLSYFSATAIMKQNAVPTQFSLEPNNPNPFNETTTIGFSIPEKSEVRLSIYDVLGKEVKALYDGEMDQGVYSVKWFGKNNDGEPLPSGIYFCRMIVGEKEFLQKMMLIM